MIRNLMFLFVFLVPFAPSAQEKLKSVEQFVIEIDKKVPQLLHDFSVPGAAIAIIEDGEIVLQKGYGFADIEKKLKVNTKTGFNVGSISKSVAAWGVMKLVQDGKIDLDVPAENYLSRWHFPKSVFDSDGVTIRRLLSHTAGLSLHSVSAGAPYDNLPTLEEWLLGKNDGLGRVEIVLEPGSKYKYSGGGFGVLQLIIEEVTGQTFEDYMQAHILDPLGMTNSSYKIDDKIMAASASPYAKYGEITDFELFTVQAGAGLHTTLEDFTRYAMASLYRHRDNEKYNPVLPADIIQQMMVPVLATGGHWTYGLGYQTEHRGTSFVFSGHSGSNEGWQANFRVNPSTNDGFIVLTNAASGGSICNQMMCDWVHWKTGESLGDWCQAKLPIDSKLKQIIDSKGIDDLSAIYTELKENQPNDYDFSEGQINELGYFYLGRKEFEKAIAIFKINVEAFPDASNVYDSYAEALLAQGTSAAIENYMKSVKLNPANGNGVRVLNELGISADDIIKRISISVDSQVLAGYVGNYQAANGDTLSIQGHKGQLIVESQKQKLNLIAQSELRFQTLGEGSTITFFTATSGQKGLWAKQTIWTKLSEPPVAPPKVQNNGKFLVFRNNASWRRSTDFEHVLAELNYNCDQRESNTMSTIELSNYDVIIIPGAQSSDYYNDYVSNTKRFNEFVAKGGTLILELNGAEKNGSIILPDNVTIVPNKSLENAILESSHPILYPLSGKSLIHARYASMGYLQNFPKDATILAVEVEGKDILRHRPTFIEYSYGKGRVIGALQCFHDRDDSGRGPLMESVISYAVKKSLATGGN